MISPRGEYYKDYGTLRGLGLIASKIFHMTAKGVNIHPQSVRGISFCFGGNKPGKFQPTCKLILMGH
jgi:hypothetical protein